MSETGADVPAELTVDELARLAGVPVRTIREYQTMRLLPPPRRQGRVGLYGTVHVARMRAIARLAGRGYSLAAIRDLFEARHAGADLGALLGGEETPVAFDEAPVRLTNAELRASLPGLSRAELRNAQAAGLFHSDGRNHVLVRSPALIALAGEAITAGVAPAAVFDLIRRLRDGLNTLSDAIAEPLVDGIIEPLHTAREPEEFVGFMRRARLLLLQGMASTFADRLGEALIQASAGPNGRSAQAAVDAVRVGAIADAAGHLQHWSRP